jgi:PAS fold
MGKPGIIPRNEEREFKFSELFFSTTDQKGIIRSGNRVFSRIAGYPLSGLRDQPHNIIRHPEMPQCAFRLVWDYLNQDKVVAAYVKNMAADGCYYWVMALIMPCQDGYLSIRLKPSSDFFPIVQNVYKDILEVEKSAQSAGMSSKDIMNSGSERLLELLEGLGFSTYDKFMWAAISAEMTARESRRTKEDTQNPTEKLPPPDTHPADNQDHHDRLTTAMRYCQKLDNQLGHLFSRLDTFSQFGDQIASKTEFILRLGAEIRLLSINAEVQSAKLGDTGAVLSVVAANLGTHSDTGTHTISRLNDRLDEIAPIISGLVFNAIASKLKIEMATHFIQEILADSHHDDAEDDTPDHAELQANVALLIQSFLETARGITSSLNQLHASLEKVDQEAGRMSKFIRTLSVINLAGKIETARSETAQAFTTIFEQVQAQTQKADSEIVGFLELINENTAQLASVDKLDDRVFNELETLVKH